MASLRQAMYNIGVEPHVQERVKNYMNFVYRMVRTVPPAITRPSAVIHQPCPILTPSQMPAVQQPYCSHTPALCQAGLCFLLRTAFEDRPQGPPTANRQPLPTATNRQPPTLTIHQSPTTNRRQPPPTATNLPK